MQKELEGKETSEEGNWGNPPAQTHLKIEEKP